MADDVPSEYRVQARALTSRLMVLEAGPLRVAAAARELAQMMPERGAWVLAALLELAREGSPEERLALEALGRALLSDPSDVLSNLHRQRLFEAAAESELPEVEALFIAPPPVLATDPDHPPKPDPALAHLTLGHKKMLARTADPDLLARLAAEAEPSVIQNILINPRLTESLVVRICARKPIRAQVLEAIYESRKWSTRALVRQAMVENPYTPPELSLKILPILSVPVLKQVANNKQLHESVREAASRLLGKNAKRLHER
jgi:hypothetical protein